MDIKKRFEIYEGDRLGQRLRGRRFYWRFRDRNGKVTVDGAQGYAKKSNAVRAVKAHLTAMGINVKGPGWRARLVRDLGIAVTIEE